MYVLKLRVVKVILLPRTDFERVEIILPVTKKVLINILSNGETFGWTLLIPGKYNESLLHYVAIREFLLLSFNNTIDNFRIKLTTRLEADKCEVGLVEISYPKG